MTSRHFSFTEFVAYQMGTRSGLVEKLAEHLKHGCPACELELAYIGRLVEATTRDRAATPPPAVRERARSVFHPLQRPVSSLGSGLVRMARLVFDSGLQPAAAGVRGTMRLDRHIVYAERELMLDMHIEPRHENESQSITGQVQSNSADDGQLKGLPVLLMEGEKVVMGTHTNQRGEFSFNDAPRGEVMLCVVYSDRQVRVPCPLPLS